MIDNIRPTHQWLANRVSMVTRLSHAEIVEKLPATIKANVFWSAKVSEASLIEELRSVSSDYSAGKIGRSEARQIMKRFLIRYGAPVGDDGDTPPPGVTEDEWKSSRAITNLGSTARLNLIFDTQKRQYDCVGKYIEGIEPARLTRWPYWLYLPSTKHNKREEHKKYYNMVIPKNNPSLAKYLPPLDFRCGCSYKQISEADAEKLGISKIVNNDGKIYREYNGERTELIPNASGYDFNPADALGGLDLNQSPSVMTRQIMLKKMIIFAKEHAQRISFVGAKPSIAWYPPIELTSKNELIKSFQATAPDVIDLLKKQGLNPENLPSFTVINNKLAAAGINFRKPPASMQKIFDDKELPVGILSKSVSESLGLIQNDIPVTLAFGDRYSGLEHTWKNHKDVFVNPKDAVAILEETIGNSNCRTAITVSYDNSKKHAGGRTVISLFNPETNAFCVMGYRHETAKVISFHRVAEDGTYPNDEWWLK